MRYYTYIILTDGDLRILEPKKYLMQDRPMTRLHFIGIGLSRDHTRLHLYTSWSLFTNIMT